MKKYLLLPLCLLFITVYSCKDSENFTPKDPTSQEQEQEKEKDPPADETRVKLPVIFHLFQNNKVNNDITQKRLAKILNEVNKLYRNGYANNSIDIEVEFVLTRKDPQNKDLKEEGLERITQNTVAFDCDKFMNGEINMEKNLQLLWDPEKFINIFLYNFNDDRTLGISHLPYTYPGKYDGLIQLDFYPKKSNLDYPHCVSINTNYIDMNDTFENQISIEGKVYTSVDITKTLAHELGHYLGLHHPFNEEYVDGEINLDICKDTDFCDDTPPYNRAEYENYLDNYTPINGEQLQFADLKNLMKRINCITKEKSTPNNIMDYSYSYLNRFTADQKERMQYVLNNSPFIPNSSRTKTRANVKYVEGRQKLPFRTIK